MQLTKDGLKARYLDLDAQRQKIRAKSGPLREKRDALVAEYQPKERELNAAIRKAEEGLFEIEQEAALIAKALGNDTPAV